MSFKDRPFHNRFAAMGDAAEGVFERTYPQGWVRFGLNRPPIAMGSLPAFIRFTPDYLTARGLVEVQGFGGDQLAKFKRDKLTALIDWHHHFRVDFFLWDSANKRYAWLRLHDLENYITPHHVAYFPEGTQYFAIPAVELPVVDAWVPYAEPLSADR